MPSAINYKDKYSLQKKSQWISWTRVILKNRFGIYSNTANLSNRTPTVLKRNVGSRWPSVGDGSNVPKKIDERVISNMVQPTYSIWKTFGSTWRIISPGWGQNKKCWKNHNRMILNLYQNSKWYVRYLYQNVPHSISKSILPNFQLDILQSHIPYPDGKPGDHLTIPQYQYKQDGLHGRKIHLLFSTGSTH